MLLIVFREDLFDAHFTELVRLEKNPLGDCSRSLSVLICRCVLTHLGLNGTELQVELAQVSIRLKLGTELLMGLLLLLLPVCWCHSNGVVFVEVSLIPIILSLLNHQGFHVPLRILCLTKVFKKLFVLWSEHFLETKRELRLNES